MSKASYTTHDAEEYRMQLRDQFAMAALTGMLVNNMLQKIFNAGVTEADKSVTRFAYLLADAMLKARNK